MAPITKLLRKAEVFEWTTECKSLRGYQEQVHSSSYIYEP
jgi:hypothetical protein